jgi:primosomal protein N' (replication factor Y) (superfamily II helicase)
MSEESYAQVVVDVAPAHLDHPFDYRVPEGTGALEVGRRVRVTFAGRKRTGWVVGTTAQTVTAAEKVRDLDAVDGPVTWFDRPDLELYRWVADRYAGTLADVLRHALPKRVVGEERAWSPPGARPAPAVAPTAAPPVRPWDDYGAQDLLASVGRVHPARRGPAFWWRPLGGEDVTGMVVDLVARCLQSGRSVLVVAPDPASPLPDAALGLAGGLGADLRGAGSADRQRYRAFLRCRSGQARVAVGERSAALTPLLDLGLVVVDDEANPAYKERRAPRHHARDVLLARARMAGATAVLLGDLPSPRLWRLLTDGHVRAVAAPRGLERSRAPRVEVVDRSDPRPGAQRARFSDRSARAVGEAVKAAGAGVIVAARGGQGSALACQGCRARLGCPVCEGSVRPLRRPRDEEGAPRWECPTCGWTGAPFACTFCGDTRNAPLAAGAGRLAQELARSHPDAEVVRMEGFDAPGPTTRPALGVMTRGSVVSRPGWLGPDEAPVVVLPDADAFMARPTMAAAEDALRLWFAVARWVVPSPDATSGRVLLQTREPAHPAVQALVRWDPVGFWEREALRRAELRYPPAATLIRLVAPTDDAARAVSEVRAALPSGDELLGPDPGGAALVKCTDLRGTLDALTPLRHAWSKAHRRVRLDVDPVLTD